jgi:hypothetical protein
MKTLIRIAAVLSFLFPFVCGVGFLIAALSPAGHPPGVRGRIEHVAPIPIAIAIGAFLVANALFVGAMLLFAAEKLSRNGSIPFMGYSGDLVAGWGPKRKELLE